MTRQQVINKIVDFFAERWIADKEAGERFKKLLRMYLAESDERADLYVDYDPQGPLLELVRQAGIECDGFLFSAKGIFNGGKFGVFWRPEDRRAEFKLGYGMRGDTLYWNE